MQRLAVLLAFLCLAAPAPAQEVADGIPELDLSAELAGQGIEATRARLAALDGPTAAETFALGGLTFLSEVEKVLQLRWRVQLSPSLGMLPVLRLPVPPNPSPEPFRAEMLREILTGMEAGMRAADGILEGIPEENDFGVTVRPADLWFDIDMDGTRDPAEGFYDVAGALLFARTGFDRAAAEGIEIRFDLADSRWLAAYAQLIRGTALAVLAYDPTEEIAEVIGVGEALNALNQGTEMANAIDKMVGDWVDSVAAGVMALRAEPDKAHAAEALAAAEAVVQLNRDFWRLVALEDDDRAEWIPNDAQHSALGLTFPEGTGDVWLEVLDEAEGLLEGRLLLPYWRLGVGRGLNLRKMFLDPRPVDPVAWVQGRAALPYAESGTRASAEVLRRFDAMVRGQGLLYAAILN